MQYIQVDKEAIPYSADMRLGGITYTLTFNYNAEGDFFTVDLARSDEVLALGEKLVYGKALFQAYADSRFPLPALIPLDASGQAERVGWSEIGESVLLYAVEPGDLGMVSNDE